MTSQPPKPQEKNWEEQLLLECDTLLYSISATFGHADAKRLGDFILRKIIAAQVDERNKVIQELKDYVAAQDPTCWAAESFEIAHGMI